MGILVDGLSWVLVLAGSFFICVGMFGLVRMPDLFTRMHAASVTDTLGAGLLFAGFVLQAGFTLVAAKLVIILALLFFSGPVVTHALSQAAFCAGILPRLSEDRRKRIIGDGGDSDAAASHRGD
jgi:multicomponent Na+:H+ antiporter subunit G